MKKKKFISAVLAAALMIPTAFGLSACKSNKSSINAKDIYALSVASSISYLSDGQGGPSQMSATEKPTSVSNDDVKGIYNTLSMFDGILSSGGVDQTIKANTSTDPDLKGFTFEMKISLPNGSGKSTLCTMYFDEKNIDTDEKFNKFKNEIEVERKFNGVIVCGEEKFIVEGEREYESELGEEEFSIEFRTYKNLNGTLAKDENNYVVFEQSIETEKNETEIEYEYTICKDGRIIQEVELEYEEGKKGTEIEFQLVDTNSHQPKETVFKIKKGKTSNKFVVSFTKSGQKQTINIEKLQNGSYKFTYSNGFSETISTGV